MLLTLINALLVLRNSWSVDTFTINEIVLEKKDMSTRSMMSDKWRKIIRDLHRKTHRSPPVRRNCSQHTVETKSDELEMHK